MDDMAQTIFKAQRGQLAQLLKMGFTHYNHDLIRSQPLLAPTFTLTITVTLPNTVTTTLIDNATQQPYTLHLAASNTGTFVATVRKAYLNALQAVADQAFEPAVFPSRQARWLIETVKADYHNDLEFLWSKFPNNAILRRSDTQKWYALLVKIPQRKLGLASDEIVTVVDFRLANQHPLIDQKNYFPAYHMNKQHWFSIILDDRVTDADLRHYLQLSYDLAQ
ncbi:hypothetical protein C5Z26_10715 [Lactobacillus sp. CBA3606]|uniref:MmcQ/YjbR family DNA-binding protein n=1 Tax=Lactobacillus sp. CBA3606 TaxID=2099789 RepID=UPI000CFD76A2|nr:MmcQ/YjbR family DNA-binding protein [Lactobacillus sp. CBA3606]AVK64550.1 hypothetical protein C5Z26_10715 [Lactobacillus sp. CBA3606]